MLEAIPTIVPDDLDGGTTGDAARAAGAIERSRAPVAMRVTILRISCLLLVAGQIGPRRDAPVSRVCTTDVRRTIATARRGVKGMYRDASRPVQSSARRRRAADVAAASAEVRRGGYHRGC
jgi:hypothetical protein